ncbi:MAG: histidine phosphatase family protein [Microthrixaceae bacterium]
MIYVVRHGQTASNAAGLLLGRDDPALDPLGRLQAAAAGEHLADRIDGSGGSVRIVASPLSRAVETAREIGRRCGVDRMETDERWVELRYGDWEGRPVADVTPGEWRRWQLDPGWSPPGGESLTEVQERVADALDDLAGPADVVVVSHVSPIKAAVCWAMGLGAESVWRMFVTPGSVTTIAPGRLPTLRSFNEQPRAGSEG